MTDVTKRGLATGIVVTTEGTALCPEEESGEKVMAAPIGGSVNVTLKVSKTEVAADENPSSDGPKTTHNKNKKQTNLTHNNPTPP